VPVAALRVAAALLVAAAPACWSGQPAPSALSNVATETTWIVAERGVGPLDGTVRATQAGVQARVPALRVRAEDLGGSSGIAFGVFDGGERLLYVVPDDAVGYVDGDDERGYAETVFAIFAMSPRVRVENRTWRVGMAFDDFAGIDRCECWGGGEVTACFTKGSRIRAVFELPCEAAERDGARAMRGKPIARIMWKRQLEPQGFFDEED
jgi:hypothetical protein